MFQRPWHAELLARCLKLWFFKSTGTTIFMVLFFLGYFYVQRMPIYPVTTMPTAGLDDFIGFWPPAFYLYASLWLYTSLVPALQPTFMQLVGYGCAIGSLCLSGLGIFFFFPTAVPFSASAAWFNDSSTALLRQIDLAGNACPSLHVATAVFTATCLHTILRELRCPTWVKASNWVWCLLIVYSTMGIKQHVMWDVLAGTALGLFFSVLYRFFQLRASSRARSFL